MLYISSFGSGSLALALALGLPSSSSGSGSHFLAPSGSGSRCPSVWLSIFHSSAQSLYPQLTVQHGEATEQQERMSLMMRERLKNLRRGSELVNLNRMQIRIIRRNI